MSILRRITNLFHRSKLDQEIEAELRSHIELRTADNIAAGMSPEEARRDALLRFGNRAVLKERVTAADAHMFLDSVWQDLCYGLRVLRKSPGFTIVAVLTLALGIGANTAIFSIVDWLILRMPPAAAPEQIVTLASEDIGGGYSNGFSYPDFVDIRNQSSTVFSEAAADVGFRVDGFTIDGESQPMWSNYVTGNFFQLMDMKPALGQFIEPTSGTYPDDEPVLVLGYSFWKAHLGGDLRVIGKSALINGHPVTIIGVAPKGFHGVSSLLDAQGYLPLGLAPVTADANKDFVTNRKDSLGMIIARLKPGVTAVGAEPALKVIAQRLSSEYPTTDKWITLIPYPLGPMSPTSDPDTPHAVWLLGALFLILAGLVLLLACLNVANLLLVRASARQREMAVRAAVGGGRSRLMRQLLTESLLLALLGCAAGIGLGLMASRSLSSINLMVGFPFILDFQFDWRVFAYASGAALLTAIIVGIAPAFHATRGNLNNLLHENARTTTAAHQRTRSLLVVLQVGGSLMLLIIAGLFARSLESVQHAHLGFDPNQVFNFSVNAHQTGYNATQSQEFLKELLPRVRALPGVETASLAATVPMGPTYLGMSLKIDGYQPPRAQSGPSAGYNAVSPQYFETMRISLLRGRAFLDSDSPTSPYVAVINEAMADKYWHSEDPVGRHLTSTDDPKHSIEVVGVVKNSRYGAPHGQYEPYIYVPLAQHYDYQQPVTLQVRTNLSLATMNREVVGVIHSLAPAMPIFGIQTMKEALGGVNGLMLFRIAAGLASSLGLLGLALAVVGVYGVVSYGASQRTHEFGIRMALGARPADVLQTIFRQGFVIVGGGLVAGVLAAAAIARLVGNFIVGVSPLDALSYVSAVLALAIVALLACYIPARRAMRVDPMVALRYE